MHWESQKFSVFSVQFSVNPLQWDAFSWCPSHFHLPLPPEEGSGVREKVTTTTSHASRPQYLVHTEISFNWLEFWRRAGIRTSRLPAPRAERDRDPSVWMPLPFLSRSVAGRRLRAESGELRGRVGCKRDKRVALRF